jgi:serine/threonine-protein kinase
VATSRIAEHVGRVLGDRYRLTRPLGTGASAHVYVAEDVSLRRRVAVKVLHPALAEDEGFLRRFQAEARVVAALRHPNIVRVYDWGEDGGSPYLVMELLEGGSLCSVLDRSQLLSPAQAVSIGMDTAKALDYAHRRGLVHRDIKPANLLFDEEGRVCVADFGLARALAEASWTEPAGAVLGTARYASPEQVRGTGLDGRADVYALALVLVEAVTGRVPFAADTTIGTLMGRLGRALPVPPDMGPLVPVLEAAGTLEADDRIDAAEMARALAEVAVLLPPPGRLTLSSPLDSGDVEQDIHQTMLPGPPGSFSTGPPEPAELAVTAMAAAVGALSPSAITPSPRAAAPSTLAPATLAVPGAAAAAPAATSAPATSAPGRAAPATSAGATSAAARSATGDDPLVDTALRGGPIRPGWSPRQPDRGRRGRRRWWVWLALILLAGIVLAGASLLASRTLAPAHPVPDLRDKTVEQARRTLGPIGFHLRVDSPVFDEHHAKGTIASQQQAPATKLREGSTVAVHLSEGPPPVNVPDLTGLTSDQASQRLIGAGFSVGASTSRSDDKIPSGTVISWAGQGGQLPKGSPVDLVVSTGKPRVAIPDVHNQSFAAAKTALAGAGLTAVESDQYHDTVPAGQVVSTTPAAAASAVVGSQVVVNVSRGPQLIAVPNVATMSVAAATSKLETLNFAVVGVVGAPDRPVTSTTPPTGTLLKKGSAVKLITG